MKKLISLLAIFTVLFMSSACAAAQHQLAWTWPVTNCDETPLDSADFIESELIYSQTAMPMTSDTEGPCSVNRDADPPAGSISMPVPLALNSIILNVQPGQTYFARIRVSAYVDGNWSSWSSQAEFTVPYSRPNIIRFSRNLLDRWEYYAIETSHLNFFDG